MKLHWVLAAFLVVPMLGGVQAASLGLSYGDGSGGAVVRSVNVAEATNIQFLTSYTVNAGVTVTVNAGSRLIIFATDFIDIQGTIDGSGKGTTPAALGAAGPTGLGTGGGGATSSAGATGGAAANTANLAPLLQLTASFPASMGQMQGAGGGGGQTATGGVTTFGGAGGAGGPCGLGGNGGAAGSVVVTGGTGGVGARGGGPVILVAPRITLGSSSVINLDGANGAPATGSTPNGSSGGGGGAGGNLVTISRILDLQSGYAITATGGTGGTGGGTGGAGAAGGTGGAAGCNAGLSGASPTNGGGGGGGGAGGYIVHHNDPGNEWIGAWSSSTTYGYGDIASYGGLSYVALRVTVNDQPDTSPSDWVVMGNSGFTTIAVDTAESAGVNCATGGRKIQHGLDNGDGGGTARDGTLQSGEVDSTSYVCNGATGATGATGAAGSDGADGLDGDPGPIGITWQGQWDTATNYAERDAVHDAGSAWYALQANTASRPAPGSPDWDFIANADGTFVLPENMNIDSNLLTTWIPILAWLLALLWCLRNAKVLAAAVATMGAAAAIVPNMPAWVQAAALTMFVVALWLEAVARDRIYSRFLNPTDRREPE